ncbi:extracellular solute-binding protein [Cohnella sp. GCM10027633]|uniref:extracellular solute-binding protein n=1 Tax=unclassified Cohnella TaxID=2636738 RepID=UPI00362CD7FF
MSVVTVRRRTRLCAALALGVFLLAALSGCRGGSSGDDGQRSEERTTASEPMEITVALWGLAETATTDDPLVKALEKKLNIRIKPIPITTANYVQQFQMWASTGQLPDIFSSDAIHSSYYQSWVEEGFIKPLPEDLSAYPHLAEYVSTPEIQNFKEDGKLYFVPRKTYDSTDYNVLDRIVLYRWDLAQQAGITKEPETWEEFRDMLAAIVAADPEDKQIEGLSAVSNLLVGGLFWLYGAPAATSDGSGSDFKWIKEDGRYIPAVFSKHAIESLKLIRQFYNDGLIDPELTVTRGEMGRDKFAQGQVAALITAGMFESVDVNIYKERWLKLYPGDDSFYDKVKVLKPLVAMDGNRYHPVFKSFWSESYVSAKVGDDKMDRILRLFDYMNAPEFKEMRHYGLEGVDYVKEGSKITMKDPEAGPLTKYKYFSGLSNLLEWDGMSKIDPAYAGISPGAHRLQMELLDYSMKMTTPQPYESRLTMLSTPTKDGFSIFDSDDMIRVMISKLPVEVIWQDIVNGYKAKGLDKMIEEVNAKAKEMGL